VNFVCPSPIAQSSAHFAFCWQHARFDLRRLLKELT